MFVQRIQTTAAQYLSFPNFPVLLCQMPLGQRKQQNLVHLGHYYFVRHEFRNCINFVAHRKWNRRMQRAGNGSMCDHIIHLSFEWPLQRHQSPFAIQGQYKMVNTAAPSPPPPRHSRRNLLHFNRENGRRPQSRHKSKIYLCFSNADGDACVCQMHTPRKAHTHTHTKHLAADKESGLSQSSAIVYDDANNKQNNLYKYSTSQQQFGPDLCDGRRIR